MTAIWGAATERDAAYWDRTAGRTRPPSSGPTYLKSVLSAAPSSAPNTPTLRGMSAGESAAKRNRPSLDTSRHTSLGLDQIGGRLPAWRASKGKQRHPKRCSRDDLFRQSVTYWPISNCICTLVRITSCLGIRVVRSRRWPPCQNDSQPL